MRRRNRNKKQYQHRKLHFIICFNILFWKQYGRVTNWYVVALIRCAVEGGRHHPFCIEVRWVKSICYLHLTEDILEKDGRKWTNNKKEKKRDDNNNNSIKMDVIIIFFFLSCYYSLLKNNSSSGYMRTFCSMNDLFWFSSTGKNRGIKKYFSQKFNFWKGRETQHFLLQYLC